MTKYYIARCKDHEWHGHEQASKEAAESDLDVHKDTYPGEEHKDTCIEEVES